MGKHCNFLAHQFVQVISLTFYIFQQVEFVDDLQNLKACGTATGVILESVAVIEAFLVISQNVDHSVIAEHSRNGLHTSCYALTDNQNIRSNARVLQECVERLASSTHATHDLVNDEESTVLVTDILHSLEIAFNSRSTSQSLLKISDRPVASASLMLAGQLRGPRLGRVTKACIKT